MIFLVRDYMLRLRRLFSLKPFTSCIIRGFEMPLYDLFYECIYDIGTQLNKINRYEPSEALKLHVFR